LKLADVKNVIEKYINKAFKLYQDQFELEVNFSQWCSIIFQWDENTNITKVIIESKAGDYEGMTNLHFQYALDFIKANSEIILQYNKIN
jgi:hypothetical protein